VGTNAPELRSAGQSRVGESVHPPLQPVTDDSRFGAPGRWLRRAVFRTARPILYAEHEVHLQLAHVIDSLDARVALGELTVEIPDELDPAVVVDIETHIGKLFLHADDEVMTPFISRERCWEPEESDFLRSALRPGHTFLDVGANVGYMTVLGAQIVGPAGRVIAIEPDESNRRLLRANLWRNGLSARLLPVAAYSRCGYLGFVRSLTNRGDHQVSESREGGSFVPCATVDDLLGDLHVDVVKIDTQGVDHEVIAGMSRLTRSNPNLVVLSEFWLGGLLERGIDPFAVLHRYRELGFTLGLLGSGASVRTVFAQDVIDACRAWEGSYVNLVLRPA
jgi:FkbM family methyltransferase